VAAGSFKVNAQVLSAGDALHSWVTNQAVTGPLTPLRLAAGLPMFSIRPHCILVACPTAAVTGNTRAESYAVSGAGRKVQAMAEIPQIAPLQEIHLFPVVYLAGPIRDRSLLKIEDFWAKVDCNAAPTGATATAEWHATLKVWQDNPALGTPGYVSYSLSSTGNPAAGPIDTLQELRLPANNPRVFNVPLSPNDLYLFNEPGKTGYLWKATSLVGPPTEILESGRYTSARIDGAIRIDTMPTDSTIPQSRLNISIGKLACEAIDRR
jgi:hypothetical protein